MFEQGPENGWDLCNIYYLILWAFSHIAVRFFKILDANVHQHISKKGKTHSFIKKFLGINKLLICIDFKNIKNVPKTSLTWIFLGLGLNNPICSQIWNLQLLNGGDPEAESVNSINLILYILYTEWVGCGMRRVWDGWDGAEMGTKNSSLLAS